MLLKQNQELSAKISALEDAYNILQEKHQLTKEELDWLKRQLFGRKSERFIGMDPGQLSLELDGMVEAMRQEDTQEVSYTRKKANKEEKPGHGRMPIPTHLRREEIIIEPEEVPEGSKKIGEEITEVMEPACRRQV